jgi:two-component system, chemotaxis family, protein-glutamate methylesterase/glutaminase
VPNHDIIVIGASAGGVETLKSLVRTLPRSLPAAVFVVLHLPAQSKSLLPTILSREETLPAVHPANGDPILPGFIYVAPPDHHLMIREEQMIVVRGPRENRHRPAVDPLFRSAAVAFGTRSVGVILTGALDDGTSGLKAVKQRGGIAIVQDPDEATYPSMPLSAMRNVEVDYTLPVAEIGPLLARLANTPAEDQEPYPMPDELSLEVQVADMEANTLETVEKLGTRSTFSCPECSGALWEMKDSKLLRFRCQVGHAYTIDSMMSEHSEAVERALWIALRALEERSTMADKLARRAQESNQKMVAARFRETAQETEEHADVLRRILLENKQAPVTVEPSGAA